MRIPNYEEVYAKAEASIQPFGYDITSAIDIITPNTAPSQAIRKCLDPIDAADIVFLLPNWHECPFSHVVYMYCLYTGKPLAFATSDFAAPVVLPV